MTRFACVLLFAVFSWGNAAADLLPPGAVRLMERFSSNPGAYDRTDAFCLDREIEGACVIPGPAFEGGGAGKCKRVMNRNENFIDLICAHQHSPRVERALAPGPSQPDAGLCSSLTRNESGRQTMAALGLVCETPPPVSDRFCQGMTPGQSCVAEVRIGDQVERATGICKSELEKRSFYLYGGQVATRPVVMCQPVNQREELPMKPVSSWRKLIQ